MLLLVLCFAVSALGGGCPEAGGSCVDAKKAGSCPSNVFKSGLCAGPSNIRCCIGKPVGAPNPPPALPPGAVQSSILNLPFYFGAPKTMIDVEVPCSAAPSYPLFFDRSAESDKVGVRVLAVNQFAGSVAEKRNARRAMAKELGRSGALKDGDIVLTFRPELADSMPYPHIQMGVTHAGLVYTKNDGVGVAAMNIDSPLDTVYMGQFDSEHYAGNGATDLGVDYMHFVRPRGMTDTKRANLKKWITTLQTGLARINGERTQLKFNTDYMATAFATSGKTPRATVTRLGKIILELDKTSKQWMFCSEFVWHMLALSGCTQEQIRTAGEEAPCVDPVFEPMPMVQASQDSTPGLGEGCLVSGQATGIGASLVNKVFCTNGYECKNNGKLSSGHRAVAEQVAPLMSGLSQIYAARLSGAPYNAIADGAKQLNAATPLNYSPTSYFIRSFTAGHRALDYLFTASFLGPTRFAAAQAKGRAEGCGGRSSPAPRV